MAIKSKKDINTELCRITLMIFIIMHHIILNTLELRSITSNSFDYKYSIYAFLNSYLVVSVNIFFIISGYYLIKFNLKKIINMIIVLYFYFISINIFSFNILNERITIDTLKSMIFPISNYWFIFVYILICIISPLLNLALKGCSKKQLKLYIIFFTIIFCVYGFLTNNQILGVNNGYSLIFAVYLYAIGYYLKNHYTCQNNYKLFLLKYILYSSINGIIVIVFTYLQKGSLAWKLYSYNNILVLLGSINLFLFFNNIKFNKKMPLFETLNISQCVLTTYIIHSTPIIAINLNRIFKKFIYNMNTATVITMLICYSISIFLICSFIELIRIKLLDKKFYNISKNIIKFIKDNMIGVNYEGDAYKEK